MRTLANSLNPKAAEDLLYRFTHGIDVDPKFAAEEVRVQQAWAEQLQACGVITADEQRQLHDTLAEAGQLMTKGEFDWRIEDEDIHINLERFLVDRLGDLGKKLHLGRSRNDLVATSLRLRLARSADDAIQQLRVLIEASIALAENTIDTIIPGMTHLQNGQPIRMAQVFTSYGYRFHQDLRRFERAREYCLEAMPLGSAAFAGTTLAIDREALAQDLGFAAPCANSYDGVGDRDFICELLHAMAMVAVHQTKVCEDLMYWSSANVALVQLPAQWSTGSSIMPNKRNPDVLELIRARSARLCAADQEGKAILRGFGSSYGSDLHELKKTFFAAEAEFMACATILGHFLSAVKVDEAVAEALCAKGHILATDLANLLVDKGATFRDAYHQAAEQVSTATAAGQQVHEGPLFSQLAPGYDAIRSVEAHAATGGTARAQVLASLTQLKALAMK